MRSKAAIAQAVEHDRLMVRRLAILISIFVAWPAAAVSIRSAADALKQGRTLLVADEPICASHPLPLFYSRRDFTPAWTSVLDRNDLLQAIRNAGRDGLDPSDYHLAAIVRTQNPDDRDLLLSDAFFLLTAHLLAGRVDPISIEPTWCLEPRTTDLVAALETALELHDIVGTVGRMAPADRRYSAMRDALAAYRQLAAIGEWPQIGGGCGLRNGDLVW
ncbi:MAG TPA: hypothetical protein VF505_00950 [Thermoanaerobaculia bacterium]